MFLKKNVRTYKGRTYTNYTLVEAVRTPAGPRQRSICSLGDLGPRPRREWLALAHRLQAALAGQGTLFGEDAEVLQLAARVRGRAAQTPPARRRRPRGEPAAASVRVDPAQVRVEEAREAGPVQVGLAFWRRLGLDAILADAGLAPAVRRHVCAMVLNRLVAPASEHAMRPWMERVALRDLLGPDWQTPSLATLYRTLDRVHPHRAAIETALAARTRDLFGLDGTLWFVDLTSTCFEGEAVRNARAHYGYSRDRRSDCKQVVIALATTREGFPVAHEVFDGNVQDRQALGPMLDAMAARLGGLPPGQTVVVDRGMAYDENLAELRRRRLHYLVASRQPERLRWLAEFEDLEGYAEGGREPSPTNPFQEKAKIEVKLARRDGETVVLCISEGRRRRDRAIREAHERKLLGDLERLRERVAAGRLKRPDRIHQAIGRLRERYPRVARYYAIDFDAATATFRAEPRAERRRLAERLDGGYILKTDRTDLGAEEAWLLYGQLTRTEQAFRDLKSPLGERPIFHQVARRVETHIFLCVLACHLLTAIEHTLRGQGVHTSWASVREALRTRQIVTVVLPDGAGAERRLRRITTPEPFQQDLYRWLQIDPNPRPATGSRTAARPAAGASTPTV